MARLFEKAMTDAASPTPPVPFKKPPVNASFAGKDYSVGATPDDELFDQFKTPDADAA